MVFSYSCAKNMTQVNCKFLLMKKSRKYFFCLHFTSLIRIVSHNNIHATNFKMCVLAWSPFTASVVLFLNSQSIYFIYECLKGHEEEWPSWTQWPLMEFQFLSQKVWVSMKLLSQSIETSQNFSVTINKMAQNSPT